MLAVPMEDFEQQEESLRLLEEHKNALAKEAREMLAENPEAHPVGLIMTPDASEAQAFAKALKAGTGQDLRGRGFVGLVPREMALSILRSNAPASLDWLEPKTVGSTRRLPLVCATGKGFRLGSVEFETK